MPQYWMKHIQTFGSDNEEIMIVCNRIDSISDKKNNLLFKSNIQQKIIRKYRRPFRFCSAKSGENVRHLFQEFVKSISREKISGPNDF